MEKFCFTVCSLFVTFGFRFRSPKKYFLLKNWKFGRDWPGWLREPFFGVWATEKINLNAKLMGIDRTSILPRLILLLLLFYICGHTQSQAYAPKLVQSERLTALVQEMISEPEDYLEQALRTKKLEKDKSKLEKLSPKAKISKQKNLPGSDPVENLPDKISINKLKSKEMSIKNDLRLEHINEKKIYSGPMAIGQCLKKNSKTHTKQCLRDIVRFRYMSITNNIKKLKLRFNQICQMKPGLCRNLRKKICASFGCGRCSCGPSCKAKKKCLTHCPKFHEFISPETPKCDDLGCPQAAWLTCKINIKTCLNRNTHKVSGCSTKIICPKCFACKNRYKNSKDNC
jgi:hypothetical protein